MTTVPAGADHGHLKAAALSSVPVVMACRPPAGMDADRVLVDAFGGAREAHPPADRERPPPHRVGRQPARRLYRRRALPRLLHRLDEAGIALEDRYVRRTQHDIESAEATTGKSFTCANRPRRYSLPTTCNTVGAFRAVNRRNRDTALCGFDDFELADMLGLPLTVVSQPRAAS
jgi:LacI family transcriptional regulator